MSAETPPTTEHRDTPRSDRDFAVDESIDVRSLIAKEQTLPFLGLTPADATTADYPDGIEPAGRRFLNTDASEARSLKAVIKALPQASSGELRAVNEFVNPENKTIDPEEIRDVDGLNADLLEAATGQSIEELAANAPSDRLLAVNDHQDIIDRRRLALAALGYPVKFRWQIATSTYSIVNPKEAYLPLMGALQKHGADEAFGWMNMRDWGGVAKLTVILPGFRRELDTSQSDGSTKAAIREHDALADIDPTMGDNSDEDDGTPTVTVYGGIQTGYDFRGSQTMWAKPLIFFPGSGTVMYGVGKRYSRRHVGDVTNAAHERAHDRVPIMEWWGNIYDDIDRQTTTVDDVLIRARSVAINFEELPFDVDGFYVYLGIPGTYAENASTRATRIAAPESRPTLWNLQLSLLVALGEFEGSRASDTFQAYNEVARDILFSPGKSIQLAAREHDLQADDDEPSIAPDQQTLSDALGEAFAIPGVEATSERELSDTDAQRVQNTIQESLNK
jgi:hypothetical protein